MSKSAHIACDGEGCESKHVTEPVCYGHPVGMIWGTVQYENKKLDFCSLDCMMKWATKQKEANAKAS